MSTKHKIVDRDELLRLVEVARLAQKRIVTTNGVFDIVHEEHVETIEQAAALGDLLIVLVNDDASVKINKGPHRPIRNLEGRMRLLASLQEVAYVSPFSEATPELVLAEIRPDIHVKGGDYVGKEPPEQAVVEAGGGTFVTVPSAGLVTSSALMARIRASGE